MNTPIQSRWTQLNSKRSQLIERGRDCAALTHPSMLPPEGSTDNTELPTPFQSLGARGVNHLASKMLITLFPAGASFLRLKMSDEVREQLGEGAGQVDEVMRKLENRTMGLMERGRLRATLYNCMRYLIVVGNSLLHMPTKGEPRAYRLDQYCVVRDASGKINEIVIVEDVNISALSEEIKDACGVVVADDEEATDVIKMYTHVRRVKDKVEWHQEIKDLEVPGSKGRTKADDNPYIAMRWNDGNGDYGRGLIEEYLGDLRSLEGLSQSIIEFSAIASKIILLVHPNAATDIDDVMDAESGDAIQGTRGDIDILQLDKYADFNVAKQVADELTNRLSHAFLLRSGTTRNAERVTAEEIRASAQELEEALGGVYTVQSQETQLPVARRLIAKMKSLGQFPKIPVAGSSDADPAIEPTIITGFEALGRGHELNRLRGMIIDLKETFGQEALQKYAKVGSAIKRFGTAHNVDIEEIFKTDEEVMQEVQQAEQQARQDQEAQMMQGMAQTALGGATPGITQGIVDAMGGQEQPQGLPE